MGMYSSVCIHKHIHTQTIGMREEEFLDFAEDVQTHTIPAGVVLANIGDSEEAKGAEVCMCVCTCVCRYVCMYLLE